MIKKLNKVVIAGRINVGKSTLFNRLSSSVKSLILNYEGVTRDFITDTVSWNGHTFELVDTGGIEFKRIEKDPFLEAIRQKALLLIEQATIIILVVDGSTGLTNEDKDIARIIHKLDKNTIVVANKSDIKVSANNTYEFYKLGFQTIIPISAQHGTGITEILEAIIEKLPHEIEIQPEEPSFNVVLLGKPNVGKSSLMNILMQEERTIVSNIPGTTREAIKDTIHFYKESICITDTAGIRRSRSVNEPIEEMMVKSSLYAVRDANIVVLLIDAHEAELSNQELKLASYVFENGKALIIIRNKQDLLTEDIQEQWKFATEPYEFLLKKIETLNISCKTGVNIGKILPLIKEVWNRYNTNFSKTALTLWIKEALEQTPLYKSGQRLKVFSAQQVAKYPPTIRLNVNHAPFFESSHLTFFENIIRKHSQLKSIPLKMIPRTITPKK